MDSPFLCYGNEKVKSLVINKTFVLYLVIGLRFAQRFYEEQAICTSLVLSFIQFMI